jgi:GWxTD domain-containing protein
MDSSIGGDFIYTLSNRGIYHFRLDKNANQGMTLINFGSDFPEMKEARELTEPLAYLSTASEYNQLQAAANAKLALDNFWLQKAGNTARARELIRVYYNRVYYSNLYFTALKPGWETDRGMIYIVFGPPQTVTTAAGQEKWIYYRKNYSSSETFTFDHVRVTLLLKNMNFRGRRILIHIGDKR